MRVQIKQLVDSGPFQTLVLILILLNAAMLGAETLPAFRDEARQMLGFADRLIIYAFAAEVALRIYAYRINYFKNGWNVFDFVIVFLSLIAATSGFAAIRAFRVLRVLRVVTVIPRMRLVVSALLDAIPGIASVGIVIILIVYVFAVIAANLYGPAHPDIFGDVFAAMYTLFQVMTLEGWADIAAEVGATHPRSWIFFLAFVLIATFTMLNLFVAIVVRAVEEDADPWLADFRRAQSEMKEDIGAMRAEITALARMLDRRGER